jgi:hypothetical protein
MEWRRGTVRQPALQYGQLAAELQALTAHRNTIAEHMIAILEAATFNETPADEWEARALVHAARELIESVDRD